MDIRLSNESATDDFSKDSVSGVTDLNGLRVEWVENMDTVNKLDVEIFCFDGRIWIAGKSVV